MTLQKVHEKTILLPNSGGYFKFIALSSDLKTSSLAESDIINGLIKSKFHFWQGEKNPEGLTTYLTNKKGEKITLPNHKIFGFYDATKLDAPHYQKQEYEEFRITINNALKQESENNTDFIKNVNSEVLNNLTQNCTFFYLNPSDNIRKELIADWDIYSFFYAFIIIDKPNNNFSIIEFGQD